MRAQIGQKNSLYILVFPNSQSNNWNLRCIPELRYIGAKNYKEKQKPIPPPVKKWNSHKERKVVATLSSTMKIALIKGLSLQLLEKLSSDPKQVISVSPVSTTLAKVGLCGEIGHFKYSYPNVQQLSNTLTVPTYLAIYIYLYTYNKTIYYNHIKMEIYNQ